MNFLRPTTEQIDPGEAAPTPEQLFALAAIGIKSAKRLNRLRQLKRQDTGRSSGALLPPTIVIPEDREELRDYRYEHSYAIRVNRRTHKRDWALSVISRYQVIKVNVSQGTELVTYRFDWDQERTTLARRRITVAEAPPYGIDDYVERFHVSDHIGESWAWETDLENVTASDIVLLTHDIETNQPGVYASIGDLSRPVA